MDKERELLEARVIINRQQSILRALGTLEEIKLLLTTLINNPTIANNDASRKQIFQDLNQAQRRYGDALAEARKTACYDCNGKGYNTYLSDSTRECRTCYGTKMSERCS